MSATYDRPPGSLDAALRPAVLTLGVALVAASFGYGLHHLPGLGPHRPLLILTGVLVAATAVALPVLVAAARRHPVPPAVALPVDRRVTVRSYAGGADAHLGAALQAAELEHGFFVDLGPQFLRAYQRTYADSPHAVALVAEVGGHRVGVLVGVLRPARHARWVLKRRGPRLAAIGGLALLMRPRLALRFMRTRAARYARGWRRRRGEAEATAEEATYAVLSHVAVVPGARGSGAGSALVVAFEREVAAAGVPEMRLVTRPGRDGAGAFYERLGWQAAETRTTADASTMQAFRRRVAA